MAGGRVKLSELSRGDLFRAADGRLWVRHRGDGALTLDGRHDYCLPLGGGLAVAHGLDSLVEPLDLPALLAELDELRTLTHDLLIDRDASVGREVGRGEALTAVEGLRREASRWGQRGPAAVSAVDLVLGRLRSLGPVRPLPPPERVAERCRALEGALRVLTGVVRDALRFYTTADRGPLSRALAAAEGALAENPPAG